MNGFAGCIQYPLHHLQKHDSENSLHFFFELYIYNTAGHFTMVKTKTFTLPSRFPPGNATVFDLNPDNQEIQTDVDFHAASQQACVYWNGFYHHRNVTLYVGIGHKPHLDDVVQFAKVEQNPVCINSSALRSNKKYFTSVKAECSGGTTVSSSDGFVIINDDNEQYSVNVYDGNPCRDNEILTGILHPLTQNNTLYGFKIERLVVGIEHTLVITSSYINFVSAGISSHSALIIGKYTTGRSVSFIPVVPDPELILDKHLFTPANIQGFVRQCINDIDFQSSTFQYPMHWNMNGVVEQHVTHFAISINEIVCNNMSDYCISEMASTTVPGRLRNYTWTRLSLTHNSFTKASIQPCFENICFNSKFSNGVRVIQKPSIVSLAAEIGNEDKSLNCTRVSVNIDAACDESNSPVMFQWYLAKQRVGHKKITSVNTVLKEQPGSVKVRFFFS